MSSINLVIALILAAVFGTLFIWLWLYYAHRFVHHRCLELVHWFHVISPPQWRSAYHHYQGTEQSYKEKSRSRLSKRRERSRSRVSNDMSRLRGYEIGGWAKRQEMIEESAARYGNENERRPRQVPQMTLGSIMTEQYNPWHGYGEQRTGIAYPQPAMNPRTYAQIFKQPYAQGIPQSSPFIMPQQQTQRKPMLIPRSVSSIPTYQARHCTAFKEHPEPQSKPKTAANREIKIRETDCIEIVDEYPSWIKEEIGKAAQPPISSSSPESVEEVPQTSFQQVVPNLAATIPFHHLPYSHLPNPTWDASVSNSRQGNGNAKAVEHAR
ncbi:hypothetical protein GQ44DRAFT_284180 [Phaeosphaeriaceae sp. PMI808]|nr:hypothetical protein GQ44DRAFT_284180 [Phaeosphaeriaceae sp. PMI808]